MRHYGARALGPIMAALKAPTLTDADRQALSERDVATPVRVPSFPLAPAKVQAYADNNGVPPNGDAGT